MAWHLSCAKATRFSTEQVAAWICPDCQEHSRAGRDNAQTPLRTNENITLRKKPNIPHLTNPSEDLQALVSEIRLMRQDMAKLQSEFFNRFEALTEKLLDYDARIVKLEEKEKENVLLKSQVAQLQEKLNQQAQHSLNSELEIIGLPESPNENPYHMVLATASKIGLNLEEVDVNYVSRVGPRRKDEKNDGQPRPLMVSFVRRAKREEFLKHAKTRRTALYSKDIVPTGPEKKLFVNERLTSESRYLFRDTRAWIKEHGFKYCWTRSGNIYVRKHDGRDGSPALQIRSHQDLQKLSGKRDG
jgi:hypothetical protein